MFKIISVSHGWFEVDFNRKWILTNSDYMGCDAPRLLLEALGDLLEDKASEACLCWQDEPGANILFLEKQSDILIVKIYATKKESYHLDFSGISLSKYIAECLYEQNPV